MAIQLLLPVEDAEAGVTHALNPPLTKHHDKQRRAVLANQESLNLN